MSIEILALGIPILALMIPIVAILTAHQRRMAEMMHRPGATGQSEIESLKQEVRDLKELVHQQTLALESYSRPISRESVESVRQA